MHLLVEQPAPGGGCLLGAKQETGPVRLNQLFISGWAFKPGTGCVT